MGTIFSSRKTIEVYLQCTVDVEHCFLILIVAAISCQGPRRIHPTPKKGYQFHLGPNQRKDLKCNGCLKIVSSIKIGLLSNSTVDEIKEVVNGACNVTRMQIKVQCEDVTQKNHNKLVELLSNGVHQIPICKTLAFCKSRAQR